MFDEASAMLKAMGQRDRGELRRHSLTAVSSFADAERSTKRKKSMATRDEPGRIEPAIGLAVIWQPVDVPMADERRIGGIDERPAADEDDAARKAREHVSSGLSEA